ncbi:hypothetical protein H8K35_03150 [Undibacterium sp. LX40W]|uniref:Uncharacterized protein n=1 Tax=Undibacterium nitidum TaxID=2762298 RepID=A0A923HV10_9BURK|nr:MULTISPECIES: hypothetical protein [Undibacterium]MBC3880616.1 hypothetical protein [Undibacterium nitidum]MBC3890648.1 hypothetical protein [Undibacterium sp. LX40W]
MKSITPTTDLVEHIRLRNDIEKAILTHAGLSKNSETDPSSLLRLVDATSESVEVCSQLQRAAVHQARRSDVPWSEIGSVMGITRQAAQQRFAPEESNEQAAENSKRISGANAFNEMQILETEGKAGYHLVGFGPHFLTVLASKKVWEHRRLYALNIANKQSQMEDEGWTYVGSWFPFHFFKRVVS